jgi:hypothetical protein
MKNIVFGLILLIYPALLSAQGFVGGMKFGVTANQIDGDYYAGYNKLGYYAGIYAKYEFNNVWSLSSGIYAYEKGAHSPPKQPYFATRIYEAIVPVEVYYQMYEHLGMYLGLNFGYIYNAYYQSTYVLNKQELSIGNLDFDYVLGLRYKVYKNIYFDFAHHYSLLPITRPIKAECWRTSMFLSWLYPNYLTHGPCWWTNTFTVGFEVELSRF